MGIYDEWVADDGYMARIEELGDHVEDWPPICTGDNDDDDNTNRDGDNNKVSSIDYNQEKPCNRKKTNKSRRKTRFVRLGDITHHEFAERQSVKERDVLRLRKAKERSDVTHLEVHCTCVDETVMEALVDLLTCDHRSWESFTLKGINDLGDFLARTKPLEDFVPLFKALGNVKSLNIHSCVLNRGHGLEALLEQLPFMTSLHELRIQGSEIDRVSVRALIKGIKDHDSKTLRLLSLRTCCFAGENVFHELVDGIAASMEQLQTLNLSFCNLGDIHVMYLVNSMKSHPSIKCIHIGGNHCTTAESVASVASWVQETTSLRDLNLRGLWIGFYQGLVQRQVDLSPLFQAIRNNSSLQSITLSENCLLGKDVKELGAALKDNTTLSYLDVSHNDLGEDGARELVTLLHNSAALEQLKFENNFCRFRCTGEIKAHAHFKWIDKRLLSRTSDTPLAVWPTAMVRVDEMCDERYFARECIPDVLFRMLSAPSGASGLPLAVRIAMNER
jgi:Ran GTPase-activating protein (RanGAP) involved in mRNA processing and transport